MKLHPLMVQKNILKNSQQNLTALNFLNGSKNILKGNYF